MLARLAERGWRLEVGIEPGFFLLERTEAGGYAPIDDHDRLPKPSYDPRRLARAQLLLHDLRSWLEARGFDVTQVVHDDAHGQHELNFSHADALASFERFRMRPDATGRTVCAKTRAVAAPRERDLARAVPACAGPIRARPNLVSSRAVGTAWTFERHDGEARAWAGARRHRRRPAAATRAGHANARGPRRPPHANGPCTPSCRTLERSFVSRDRGLPVVAVNVAASAAREREHRRARTPSAASSAPR